MRGLLRGGGQGLVVRKDGKQAADCIDTTLEPSDTHFFNVRAASS